MELVKYIIKNNQNICLDLEIINSELIFNNKELS